MKSLLIAALAAVLVCAPASAENHTRKKAKDKKEKVVTGASCKAPAVGPCASCAITCRPAETATCAPAQVSVDTCMTQAACKCTMR